MKSISGVLLIFLLCFVSCRATVEQSAPHSDAGHALIGNFAKVAQQEYGLFLFGQGGGFIDTVNRFSFDFMSLEEMEKDKARRFYLTVLDRLLNMINSDVTLRPYLHHYPFTNRDVKLEISFCKDGDLRNEPDPPYVAFVSMHEDIIEYAIKSTDPKKI